VPHARGRKRSGEDISATQPGHVPAPGRAAEVRRQKDEG